MSKKVLIFGSSGQLGLELHHEMSTRGYSVTGFDRNSVDITDAARVEECITSREPAIVFNAGAYNQVDVAEREPAAAYQVNALAVRNLALACRQTDAMFVHYSTDYVFDGTLGRPYVEEDRPHPLGAYGVSKLAGELYARAYCEKLLVVRTSGVFGPAGLFTPRGNFIELMLRLAAGGQTIRVVQDHVASPTYAPLLAARTADLVELGARGVFHIGGGQPISWYEYARTIFDAAGLTPEVRPTDAREYRTAAARPQYSALSNSKMEAAGVAPMPALEFAVRSYMAVRARKLSATR